MQQGSLVDMNTIYIVPIEPIDQRYTQQWYDNIPVLLADQGYRVVTVDGEQMAPGTTAGAFLDFSVTNAYKASQTQRIAQMFNQGEVKPGDKFLVTDAWNFVITAIKYMSDLLDIPVEIHGVWHAGAYDPTDILGMKMAKPWPHYQEMAWFHACDYNYFATEFHRGMFLRNLSLPSTYHRRAIVSGQPHEPIVAPLLDRQSVVKEPKILWPHRLNSDKQPEIAQDLGRDYYMVVTQKLNLDKASYYDTMAQCSVAFSCALHENLGISMMEATLCGAIPIVPDRASYSEMYLPEFKYPSEWTRSLGHYHTNRAKLVDFINDRLHNADKYAAPLKQQQQILIDRYLNAKVMVGNLLNK